MMNQDLISMSEGTQEKPKTAEMSREVSRTGEMSEDSYVVDYQKYSIKPKFWLQLRPKSFYYS